MAYNLSERFQSSPKYYRFLDPGTYQYPNTSLIKPNKVPFLSKSCRSPMINRPWTDAIYNPKWRPRIPNCTSIQSKVPRFDSEDYDYKDIEDILCDCESNATCECPVEDDTKAEGENVENETCQAKVRRRIFKGLAGHYPLDKGISITPRKVPFYETKVHESTLFYRGCKWSKRTSERVMEPPESGPGPTEYSIEPEPSLIKTCAEKVRSHKRKESRQLRLAEETERRTLLNNFPGPASYNPILPRRKDFHYTTSKIQKVNPIIYQYNVGPGPSDYFIQRDFEPKKYPDVPCHANLLPPAPFGFNAARFKSSYKEGPSPASYNVLVNICPHNYDRRCNKAPFGISTKRFDQSLIKDDSESDCDQNDEEQHAVSDKCKLSWQFKSKTIRMKLPKANNLETCLTPQTKEINIRRSTKLQYLSPFNSSEGRFRDWYNWIPVNKVDSTPGVAYYCSEKPKCIPAVCSGPLYRARRFKSIGFQTPAPDFFPTGIEDILKTHNFRLQRNIDNQHKFHWVSPLSRLKLSPEEEMNKLLNETFEILCD